MRYPVQIHGLYISDGHNFRGHHGKPPGGHSIQDVSSIECLAGRGIQGDRYLDHAVDFKGQITFFDQTVYHALTHDLQVISSHPSNLRRNILLAGVNLNRLIGQHFNLNGIQFFGTEECRPCYWMDQAIAPGAEEYLRGQGGLRARILTSGTLKLGDAEDFVVRGRHVDSRK